jgi:hypothetical protein
LTRPALTDALSALRPGSALTALAARLRRASGTLLAELFLLTRKPLLALSSLPGTALLGSALRPGSARLSTLATLLERLRPAGTLFAELLLLAWTAWLAGAPWLAGLAALLGLPLLSALLALLFVLVLRILTLGNDEVAVGSTRTVECDAQLRDRDRRHQGAGEQDVAKLLQLPDGFEWQVPLLKCDCDEAHRGCAACRPDCGTSSVPLRPDFGSRLNGFG